MLVQQKHSDITEVTEVIENSEVLETNYDTNIFTHEKNIHSYKIKYHTAYGILIDSDHITIFDRNISLENQSNQSNQSSDQDNQNTITENETPDTHDKYDINKIEQNNITYTFSTQNFMLTDLDQTGRFAVFGCSHALCYAILDLKTGLFYKDLVSSEELSSDSAFYLDIEEDTFHYLHTQIGLPSGMPEELHQILLKNNILNLQQLQ